MYNHNYCAQNMNNIYSNDNVKDEFECSECDFTCSSENDMIEHSVTHQQNLP